MRHMGVGSRADDNLIIIQAGQLLAIEAGQCANEAELERPRHHDSGVVQAAQDEAGPGHHVLFGDSPLCRCLLSKVMDEKAAY